MLPGLRTPFLIADGASAMGPQYVATETIVQTPNAAYSYSKTFGSAAQPGDIAIIACLQSASNIVLGYQSISSGWTQLHETSHIESDALARWRYWYRVLQTQSESFTISNAGSASIMRVSCEATVLRIYQDSVVQRVAGGVADDTSSYQTAAFTKNANAKAYLCCISEYGSSGSYNPPAPNGFTRVRSSTTRNNAQFLAPAEAVTGAALTWTGLNTTTYDPSVQLFEVR
jgi:hypothetical protein